ncbi:hypothetical protein [Ferruginibacter sp.]|uniref:hypothetical protein n=1 Tax=Ferruginibacter sp. TaxID=1940288 RepID=UPI00265A9251|nr:hypothetical protein [Ferruginibacter sp.]
MKTKSFLIMALFALFFIVSCKKQSAHPQLTFSNNVAQGIANSSGEYTITGHISSVVSLSKVVLTKEGQTTPFLVDDATAKNKNEYDFSYLVTGITANTYIIIDIFDQGAGKITQRFLITIK